MPVPVDGGTADSGEGGEGDPLGAAFGEKLEGGRKNGRTAAAGMQVSGRSGPRRHLFPKRSL
ncbi:hypothetical protein ABZX85_44380 [Streptomyces sp. NPDC004539]|uniref:hypothetical protein n=1 Tax=Streptomyces sp. NPDC004539 TaxID=3154280 RepID=UPI00339EE60B